MPFLDILVKIIFPVLSAGTFLLIGAVKYNFDNHVQGSKKLREEFDVLREAYHKTREELIRLQAEAVTRKELKEMFKEFEQRFDTQFKALDDNLNTKLSGLKDLLTEKINNH